MSTVLPAPAPDDWTAHSGAVLLRTIATAVIDLADLDGLESYTLPYPAEAQRALDRTVLACLLRSAEPPRSLPDLLSWCRERPVADWPLRLPEDAVAPDHFLLDPDTGTPTELCLEWALRTRDSAGSQYDRSVIHTAMRLCRQADEPESYTAFRRLLVEKPVLTQNDRFHCATDLRLEPVRMLIDQIYEPVPDGYLRRGVCTPCRRCLTLLTPLTDGGWWCERDSCRRQGPPVPGPALDVRETRRPCHLPRPLRQFVTGPGRSELDLEANLRQLNLQIEMWPGYDAYDVRITFPDGHVWAVDVKDWANPALLGRAARPVPPEPAYDEAFWVVPRHRVEARPSYQAVYQRHRPSGTHGPRLLTDLELLESARRRQRDLTRRSRRHENGPTDA